MTDETGDLRSRLLPVLDGAVESAAITRTEAFAILDALPDSVPAELTEEQWKALPFREYEVTLRRLDTGEEETTVLGDHGFTAVVAAEIAVDGCEEPSEVVGLWLLDEDDREEE